jgi:hypothetical protein
VGLFVCLWFHFHIFVKKTFFLTYDTLCFIYQKVTHSLTILFFSRSYIKSKFNNSSETLAMINSSTEKSSIREDTDGRLYEVCKFIHAFRDIMIYFSL